jgi:hypothetical protein
MSYFSTICENKFRNTNGFYKVQYELHIYWELFDIPFCRITPVDYGGRIIFRVVDLVGEGEWQRLVAANALAELDDDVRRRVRIRIDRHPKFQVHAIVTVAEISRPLLGKLTTVAKK